MHIRCAVPGARAASEKVACSLLWSWTKAPSPTPRAKGTQDGICDASCFLAPIFCLYEPHGLTALSVQRQERDPLPGVAPSPHPTGCCGLVGGEPRWLAEYGRRPAVLRKTDGARAWSLMIKDAKALAAPLPTREPTYDRKCEASCFLVPIFCFCRPRRCLALGLVVLLVSAAYKRMNSSG
jgi:hypothetical protein